MNNEPLLKKLYPLVQLDIDATHAYEQAIENIDAPLIKEALEGFREDHIRHVQNLSGIISGLGGKVPEFKKDFKGYVIDGFTALRSKMGNEQALKAMRTNERVTNSSYGEALTWDAPEDILSVIRGNADDERKHLQYIERALRERSWEQSKRAA